MMDADEVLNRIRATTWDDEHDRETFALSRPAALELLSRLAAPAAPAPRDLIESPERKPDESQTPYIARLARHVRAGELTIETALHAALCAPRLGAPGKAGWTKERPTKPGYYWTRVGIHTMPVEVRDGPFDGLFAMVFGVTGQTKIDEWDCEWLGPLAPEER